MASIVNFPIANWWTVAHDAIAPVMVMPDINGGLLDDTECVDGTQGSAETYLTERARTNSWLWQPAFDRVAARLALVEETPAMTAPCERIP